MSQKENDMSDNLDTPLKSPAPHPSRLREFKRALHELFIEPFEEWGWFKTRMALNRADRRYCAAGRQLLLREYPLVWDDISDRSREYQWRLPARTSDHQPRSTG